MTDPQRKVVGYLIRQACDHFAATAGNAPVWEKRKHMREAIAQHVEEQMALFGVEGYLAELLMAANRGHGE
jgi:hypothetical protein